MWEIQITQIIITISYIFYALKDFQWEPFQDDLWSEKSFVFEKTKRNCGKFQVYEFTGKIRRGKCSTSFGFLKNPRWTHNSLKTVILLLSSFLRSCLTKRSYSNAHMKEHCALAWKMIIARLTFEISIWMGFLLCDHHRNDKGFFHRWVILLLMIGCI